MAATPQPLPPQMAVTAYRDPVVEAHGYPANHPVVLWGYPPIIGPSATLLYLHLTALIQDTDTAVTVDTADLLAGIGLSGGLTRNSIGAKTLARMATFDLLRRNGAIVAVRQALPPLSEARRRQLPVPSRRTYDRLTGRIDGRP